MPLPVCLATSIFSTRSSIGGAAESLLQTHSHGTPWFKMVVSCTWMRENDAESEFDYEYRFIAYDPGQVPGQSNGKGITAGGPFRFEKLFHRIDMMVQGAPPFSDGGSGTSFIECIIRRVGETEWIRQSYPIYVELGTSGQMKSCHKQCWLTRLIPKRHNEGAARWFRREPCRTARHPDRHHLADRQNTGSIPNSMCDWWTTTMLWHRNLHTPRSSWQRPSCCERGR